ncbi:Rab-GTPase-TBC domain [Pseudocohnilembus persalinus]|uniref:Rab-GTPase-TBC domain n=1 Tax=Pseudocohnilembus persalinus TaxID=266149 RepID=A0A0V0QDD9_PSEPJ|nr:Rab-GTPase-TBC domain [Pseudocohnilembus persalinus]|eukprot:KRX00228.1 Rab-GTPase-TBC domain [Pseudocohnilembus persalinus]
MYQIFEWKSKWVDQLIEFQSFNDLSNTFHLAHHALHKKNSEIVWKEINQQIYPNFDPESKEFKNIVKKEIEYIKGIRKEAQELSIQEIWLIASNAQYYMNDIYKGYYDKLKFSNFPDFYRFTILKDVDRTFFSHDSSQQMFQQLYNLLMVYSRRNAKIGYCQGMNFIASFLLQQNFNEEQCFWILANVLEEILPLDYYTNMTGAVIDKKAFQDILDAYNPQVSDKLSELELDLTIFCTNWFVCLFTNTLSYPIVQVVWDNLLLEGTIILIKVGLVILDICEQEILEATNFPDVLISVEQACKNIKDQKDFQKRINSIYINKQIVQIIKEIHRERQLVIDKEYKRQIDQKRDQKFKYEIDKTMERVLSRTECLPYWPICHHYLQSIKPKQKKNGQDFFVFKQQKSIKPNFDYFTNVQRFNDRFSQASFKSNKTKKIIFNNYNSQINSNQNSDTIQNFKRNYEIMKSLNSSLKDDEKVEGNTDEETQLQNSSNFNSSHEFNNKNLQSILIERQKHICIDFQRSKLQQQRNSVAEKNPTQNQIQFNQQDNNQSGDNLDESNKQLQAKIETINPLEIRKKYQQSKNLRRRQTKSIGQKDFQREFKFENVQNIQNEKQVEGQTQKDDNLFQLQNNHNNIKLDPYKTLNQELKEKYKDQQKTLPKSNTYLYLEDQGKLVEKSQYLQIQQQLLNQQITDSNNNLKGSQSKESSALKQEIQNDLEILKEYARQIKQKMSQSNSIMFIKNLPVNKSKRIIGYNGFDQSDQGDMSNTSSKKNIYLEDDLNLFKQELQEGQMEQEKSVRSSLIHSENIDPNLQQKNIDNLNSLYMSRKNSDSQEYNQNQETQNQNQYKEKQQQTPNIIINEARFESENDRSEETRKTNNGSQNLNYKNIDFGYKIGEQIEDNSKIQNEEDFINQNYVVQDVQKQNEEEEKFLKVNSRNLLKMLSFQNLLSSNANSRQFMSPMVSNFNINNNLNNTILTSPENLKNNMPAAQSCTIKQNESKSNLLSNKNTHSNQNFLNNTINQDNKMNQSNQSRNFNVQNRQQSHQTLLQQQQMSYNLASSNKKKNMLSMQLLNGFTIGNYPFNQLKQSQKQLFINQDLMSQNQHENDEDLLFNYDQQNQQQQQKLQKIQSEQMESSKMKNSSQNNQYKLSKFNNGNNQLFGDEEEVHSSNNFIKFIDGKNSIQYLDIEKNNSSRN